MISDQKDEKEQHQTSRLGMQALGHDLVALQIEGAAHAADVKTNGGHALCGHYGLTPAETRLALFLAAGASVGSAAQTLGVSVHTARTQLKRIFTKTRTGRQADLVRLLLTGPLPATNGGSSKPLR